MIDGSSTLSLYGIRESKDIDYLINDKEKITFNKSGYESHDMELIYHEKTKIDLLYNPDFHFIYNGLKFVSLRQLYKMKKNRDSIKDRNDCQMMDRYLSGSSSLFAISRMKQSLYYIKLRLIFQAKKSLINLLKNSILHIPLKKAYQKLLNK